MGKQGLEWPSESQPAKNRDGQNTVVASHGARGDCHASGKAGFSIGRGREWRALAEFAPPLIPGRLELPRWRGAFLRG